jgi:acetyltransferase-like isoleucine patch superfamily enzyme
MIQINPEPQLFNFNKTPIIGNSVSLVNTILDCIDQITIGDYVSFGHDCKVLCGYHDMKLKGKERQDTILHKPVVIKNGVWIASDVTICPGVTIGENSVVGAGSLVLKDIPDNEFWAGVPARFIKKI